ncbi:hypothetical protein CERZMDRAFT_117653 [Cercospora zeae-maydis SCOH1-5]|uniref:Erythromycin esterase n=1 Tax=Cercospora zeae-maydis SCOH1-5 TaxID=717836 RepID=A0A6A6FG20_9PEZI|nr:hypothetical protein CERZMDRAFT_117653 [Cercospora zeae-maydis SCOH1-5]
MARRSSARLRNQNTPKRVSLSHDAPIRTPRTLPAKLSVEENDEVPGAFPTDSPSTATVSYPSLPTNNAQPTDHQTPTRNTEIKPDERKMHPQLHHQSTAKIRDEARHLGFLNMAPHTEPAKQKGNLAALQGTPTKVRDLDKDAKSPSYQFTFSRDFSLELSPEAKMLMSEKREEAARIRQHMMADGEALPSIDEVLAARRMAKPKGRFSQAHMKEQDKMDSIANHASAWRADPSRFKPVTGPKPAGPRSLKRSPSKARLDETESSSRPGSSEGSKTNSTVNEDGIPRPTSSKYLARIAGETSPAKRVKIVETDDASASRPKIDLTEEPLSATPNKQSKITTLSTPTQSSLARAASVKSAKAACNIPAPQFKSAATPLKSALKKPIQTVEPQTSTPLLARSPSKASLFPTNSSLAAPVQKSTSMMNPSFARTPAKAGVLKKHDASEQVEISTKEKPVPLLSRSPAKAPTTKTNEDDPFQATVAQEKPVPLLSRSPAKAPITRTTNEEDPFQATASDAVPFLSRSPTKLPMVDTSNAEEAADKSTTTTKLIGRFNLLRKSPMKSILRSPQRLYSDDPFKVAAGTHLATPPGKKAATLNKELPPLPPTTNQSRKHVDFSSSTKARDAKLRDVASSSDSKTPTQSPRTERVSKTTAAPVQETEQELGEGSGAYPSLPLAVPSHNRVPSLSPSPQKRRQTAGPHDFTFHGGEHDIVFAQSPNAPASAARSSRPATIRYVSADATVPVASPFGTKKRKFEFENRQAATAVNEIVSPPVGTKKRKFDFENKVVTSKPNDDVDMVSDKENTPKEEESERPAKRAKPNVPTPKGKIAPTAVPRAAMQTTAAATARRTTLGVKPKGVKNASPVKKPRPSSTISQARLAALSQPKKRN